MAYYNGKGEQVTISDSGEENNVINGVTTQTAFEDFKTSGWYNIPSSWYELICNTFNIVSTTTPAYGGLLRVLANTGGTYIRYWFYPFGGNMRTIDQGITSNAYGYNAYGHEEEYIGFFYPNNDTKISWSKNTSALTDTIRGKTILICGDSIPAGFSGFYGFAERHQCKINNKCNGGASIAYRTPDKTDSYDSSCLVAITDSTITGPESRYYLDIENSDAVVIWMGTNDFGNSIPIGALSDIGGEFDDNTMIGALQHSIENIISRNKKINIIMFSPMYRYCNSRENKTKFEKYVDAVISVANLYHIPIKDMYHDCGITDINRNGFLDSAGLHPSSKEGMAMIRAKFEKWIEQNI